MIVFVKSHNCLLPLERFPYINPLATPAGCPILSRSL
jgi:hypothetical protein